MTIIEIIPHRSAEKLDDQHFEKNDSNRTEPEKNDDERIRRHFSTTERSDLFPYDRYQLECHKFSLAPIKAVKKCLLGEPNLNLARYRPGTLGVYLLCEALAYAPTAPLKKLDLSNSPFDETGCLALSDLMQQNLQLEYVNLSNCRIGPQGAKHIAEGIRHSQSITYLNLSGCVLNDGGGAAICEAITNNEICKSLDLSHNHLFILTATEIGKMLKNNHTLEELNLNWNDLFPQKEGIVKIFKGLQVNSTLKYLNLSWNGLNGRLFTTNLKRILRTHKTLKILNLQNNCMNSFDATAIIAGLKKSPCIEELYVGGNTFYEDDLFEIIKSSEACKTLKILCLGEGCFLNKDSYELATNVMSTRPAFKIVFGGKILPNLPEPVDFKLILLDRIKFKAMSPKIKRRRKDIGHFMLQLSTNENEFVKREEFEEMLNAFKAKLDENLVNHIMDEFTVKVQIGKRKKKVKRIAIHEMSKLYLERHPTEPPPPPKPKKKRAKKTKK